MFQFQTLIPNRESIRQNYGQQSTVQIWRRRRAARCRYVFYLNYSDTCTLNASRDGYAALFWNTFYFDHQDEEHWNNLQTRSQWGNGKDWKEAPSSEGDWVRLWPMTLETERPANDSRKVQTDNIKHMVLQVNYLCLFQLQIDCVHWRMYKPKKLVPTYQTNYRWLFCSSSY